MRNKLRSPKRPATLPGGRAEASPAPTRVAALHCVGAGLAPARSKLGGVGPGAGSVGAGLAPARVTVTVALLALTALTGCRQDMHDQPKYEPLETSAFFSDGRASRQPVPGTVARGELRDDDHLYRGLDANGELAATLPMPVTAEALTRGRERFDIFCSPCHGRAGDGRGMIVRRGFKQPESFHQDRLRDVPVGYFFEVATNGFGQMSGYSAQIPVKDRWAIGAYIRALQLSRNAPVAMLDATDLAALETYDLEISIEDAGHHDGHPTSEESGE